MDEKRKLLSDFLNFLDDYDNKDKKMGYIRFVTLLNGLKIYLNEEDMDEIIEEFLKKNQ
jgi:hypothetical protein